MLTIRMQRTGRKGHAEFRVVVQDARRTPTSGKIVASLGSYNPHSKTTTLDKDKASFYLERGAQPSTRVVSLLKTEGIKLPSWVRQLNAKERTLRHPDKLRKNRPAEEASVAETPPVAEETPAVEEKDVEAIAEETVTTTDEPSA